MSRLINDDRVGRALDELFSSDRASLLTALSLRAIHRFVVDVSELHNDSTSITHYGAYRDATAMARAGVALPVPERGFSKDHRGDLLQLVEILTVSADGVIPIAHRLADATGRAWIASGSVVWEEIARRPGKRKDGADEVYCAAEASTCSAEGYRIVWIRSSDKRGHDAAARTDRIERARVALGERDESLRSKRSRLQTLTAVEETAAPTALGFCLYVALLVHALIDGHLPCQGTPRGVPPTLDPFQRRILTLLKIPRRAYRSTSPTPRYSR